MRVRVLELTVIRIRVRVLELGLENTCECVIIGRSLNDRFSVHDLALQIVQRL
jgi:hypothetical protein